VIARLALAPERFDLFSLIRALLLALACIAIPVLAVIPTWELSIALSGIIIVTVASIIRPEIAVIALAMLVPFSGALKVPVGETDISPTEPLFALFLISWGLRASVQHRTLLPPARFLAPVATLLLFVIVSSLAASKLPLTAKEAIKWLEILSISAFVAVYFRERSWKLGLLSALFVAASLEALTGVYQFITSTGPANFAIGPFMRAYGHFGQPNPFAGYLASLLPLALVSLLWGPARNFRVAAGVCFTLAGIATLMSLSRGAWLGLILALGLMLLRWRPDTARIMAAFCALGMLIAVLGATNLLPPLLAERLAPVVEYFGVFDVRGVTPTPENFALIERLAHWEAGWGMLLDHPWLGVGAGNYPDAYDDYALPGWPESLGHAHNYYLNMAAEAGLPALAALLWVLISLLRHVGTVFIRSTGWTRALALGLFGSMVVFAVHSLFDNLLVNSMAVQLGVFLGLAATLSETEVDRG
jgi:putative inorganic carbon (HCO3(-)) transporter